MLCLKPLLTAGNLSVRKCIKYTVCHFNAGIPCKTSRCCAFPTLFMVHEISCCNKNTMADTYSLASTKITKTHKHTRVPCSLEEERIIDKYKEYYYSKSKNNFQDALFVLGPMGSGKTTVIKSLIMTHEKYGKYAYVDTDELMAHLPGFDENKIDLFYPIARRMAIELTDWLLAEKLSFVAEGTCVKYQELIDYMIRLKEEGYKINVCKIDHLSLELVLHRASNRIHRKVPPELVEEIYLQSHFGISEIYRQNIEHKLFENIDTNDL